MTLPYSCSGCNRRWSGVRTAHCASCHTTFSAPHNFDEHRKGGTCQLPERVGLKWTTRHCGADSYQIWFSGSMDDDIRAQFDGRRQ